MALTKTTMAVCDNPDCQERREHSRNSPAVGLHLRGKSVDDNGEVTKISFYAHDYDCLSQAAGAVEELNSSDEDDAESE